MAVAVEQIIEQYEMKLMGTEWSRTIWSGTIQIQIVEQYKMKQNDTNSIIVGTIQAREYNNRKILKVKQIKNEVDNR